MNLEEAVKNKEDLLKRRWDLNVERFKTGEVYDELISLGHSAEELGDRPSTSTYHSNKAIAGLHKQRGQSEAAKLKQRHTPKEKPQRSRKK